MFTPVIKSNTLCFVLDVVVSKHWPIRQVDVNNAFLQGTLEDEVYMEQPPGFIDHDHPDYVCSSTKQFTGSNKHGELDAKDYRKLVGSFQYLALTRPDIMYVVNYLSQFMHHQTTDHCHLVSWSSRKQKSVALASTEAEYGAIANVASEISWICNLLTELRVTLPTPPEIHCDNVGATFLCANPLFILE